MPSVSTWLTCLKFLHVLPALCATNYGVLCVPYVPKHFNAIHTTKTDVAIYALYAKTIDAQCNRNNQQFLSRMIKSKKI